VKLIHPDLLGAKDEAGAANVLRRFEREAQATASLRSPHTIELYDFGISRDGTFYYVMELLDGIDLQRLVEQHGPQPAERVVALLKQACHSLYEAHQAGMIHRDIKPANLFVCRYGADLDFVKVLDFGIVKRAQPEAGLHRAGDGPGRGAGGRAGGYLLAGLRGLLAPYRTAGVRQGLGHGDGGGPQQGQAVAPLFPHGARGRCTGAIEDAGGRGPEGALVRGRGRRVVAAARAAAG
jgi:serine/threonine protein kinase